jgi:mannose-6-phosphate isomerase-like protein (cupin superfamily)
MRPMVMGWIAVTIAACRVEHTGIVAGPALTVGAATPTSSPPPPPIARFVELTDPTADRIDLSIDRANMLWPGFPKACNEDLVTPVTGTATIGDVHLATGDVLVIRGVPEKNETLSGSGLALIVAAQDSGCVTRTRVVRATQARELTFAGGTMHAHLDIDDRDVASFYLGRLSGTASVPEHAHEQSWEVLCAVEASGTLTLDGKESRLGPRTCVSVPPGAKHSWKPDPGSNLVAVQMYSPPGPEQRFKKLAADDGASAASDTASKPDAAARDR